MAGPEELMPNDIDPNMVTETLSYDPRSGDRNTYREYGLAAGQRLVERVEASDEKLISVTEFAQVYLPPDKPIVYDEFPISGADPNSLL